MSERLRAERNPYVFSASFALRIRRVKALTSSHRRARAPFIFGEACRSPVRSFVPHPQR